MVRRGSLQELSCPESPFAMMLWCIMSLRKTERDCRKDNTLEESVPV